MEYLGAFLVCGIICLIAQTIYDHTKLTAGHITSLFVVIGAFLDYFQIYDWIMKVGGVGASLPITSFGHLLMESATKGFLSGGFLGMLKSLLISTSAGISIAIVSAFFVAILFKPRS